MSQSLIVALIVIVAIVVIAIVSVLSRTAGRPRLRPLPEESRERYARSWQAAEARFVTDPRGAVREADRTAVMVLGERGATLGDGKNVPDDLRRARDAARAGSDMHDTEGMRRAMVHYKRIVDDAIDPQRKEREVRRREIAC
jgi:hypothetical protein